MTIDVLCNGNDVVVATTFSFLSLGTLLQLETTSKRLFQMVKKKDNLSLHPCNSTNLFGVTFDPLVPNPFEKIRRVTTIFPKAKGLTLMLSVLLGERDLLREYMKYTMQREMDRAAISWLSGYLGKLRELCLNVSTAFHPGQLIAMCTELTKLTLVGYCDGPMYHGPNPFLPNLPSTLEELDLQYWANGDCADSTVLPLHLSALTKLYFPSQGSRLIMDLSIVRPSVLDLGIVSPLWVNDNSGNMVEYVDRIGRAYPNVTALALFGPNHGVRAQSSFQAAYCEAKKKKN